MCLKVGMKTPFAFHQLRNLSSIQMNTLVEIHHLVPNDTSKLILHIVKDVVDEMKLSIHPFVLSSIHGWHHTWKKTLVQIINNPPPLRMCRYLGKTCPGPGGSDINIKPKGPNTP